VSRGRGVGRWSAASVLAATLTILSVRGACAERLVSVARLVGRLQRAGRGEAALTQEVLSGGETLRSDRGRIVLEPPDRMRIDFRTSGERVTMRADGGEWIQPSLRQLLILRPEQAQAVVTTWRSFLAGGASAYRERPLGARVYRLIPKTTIDQGADSLDVELGSDGLPDHVSLWVGDQRWKLRLSGWTFGKARGPSAFTLRAPPGYSVFNWP